MHFSAASKNISNGARHRSGRRSGPTVRLAVPAFILLLAACNPPGVEREFVERPVENIYNEAIAELESGDYESSVRLFEEVERQHPYSVFAIKAQLMAAYASYADQEYDQAINALTRFIQLHPGNRDIAYAYYLRALSYYDQITDIRRDQQVTEQAVLNLEEVIRRFPDSDYARDADLKLDLARDHLAGKEMEVGRFYQQRQNHTAAVNRFQNVVDEYDTTTHVPEALHRLVESYVALGLLGEAQEVASVLGHNYPGSDWYINSFELLTGEEVELAAPIESPGVLERIWPF